MKTVVSFISTVVFLVLIGYGVIHIFDIEIVNLIDWIVGIASFVWLVAITVIPWNAHFRAKEVLDDAAISKRKDILVIDESLKYVEKVAQRSLYVAISLHVFSAVALYFVAILGVSPVGYFGAGTAILLTFFRPTVQFYEYLQKRLGDIRKEFRYPREDVRELLNTFENMKTQVANLEMVLSTNPKKPSWRQEVERKNVELNGQLDRLQRFFDKEKLETKEEFDKVREESKEKFEKLVADSQILESVRVLSKFLKEVKV